MAACDRAISFQNTLTRGYPVMTAAVYPLKGALPLYNTGFQEGAFDNCSAFKSGNPPIE